MTRRRSQAAQARVLERALVTAAARPSISRNNIFGALIIIAALMAILPNARAAFSARGCTNNSRVRARAGGGTLGRSVSTGGGVSPQQLLQWQFGGRVPTVRTNERKFYKSIHNTCIADNSTSDLPTEKATKALWEGASHSSSVFVTHFIAGAQARAGALTVEDAIQSVIPAVPSRGDHAAAAARRRELIMRNEQDALLKAASPELRHDPKILPSTDGPLFPIDLLALGSVWYLPAGAPRDPARGGKPKRLSAADADKILDEGDYLRIHHSPRRFPAVNNFDWGRFNDEKETAKEEPPGVIIAQHDEAGYLIIDKPAGIGVHPTVDNLLENVSAAIGRSLLKQREATLRASIGRESKPSGEPPHGSRRNPKNKKGGQKQKKEPLVYISNPQRLDQNTSGLFVLSTNKVFASYFAKLLRNKTDDHLSDVDRVSNSIHKTYKCLVCLSPGTRREVSKEAPSTSVFDELARLRKYESEQTIIKHYLEPSIRAPKNFVSVAGNSTWAESLLRITNVGQPCAVVGSSAAESLSIALWKKNEAKPEACVAVVEVEVELLTGRTHQVRGQLSAEGFPLVGDSQYGGAIPQTLLHASTSRGACEKLALQCCGLEFLEPDFVTDGKEQRVAIRSDRWKTFRLNKAWWTPMIEEYATLEGAESTATFSASDEEQVHRMKAAKAPASKDSAAMGNASNGQAHITLPRQVQLSPGVHKYVIIKSTSPSSESLWFVRSASPAECGGPYHANVARSLVEELSALGFESEVTGGGRIDFAPPHAHVYGFSYGFGKGDHERAARIIEECIEDETYATFDNSDGIY